MASGRSSTEAYQQRYQRAQAALTRKDPQAAFQEFREAVSYPNLSMSASSSHWKEVFGFFAQVAEPLVSTEIAFYIKAVARHPRDEKALYNLGYHLIEHGLPRIAATVLARAYWVLPDSISILSELSIALEQSNFHAAAYDFLKTAPSLTKTNFLCRYLLAFNALMTTRIEEARKLVPALERLIGKIPEKIQDETFMLSQIKQMLARADAIHTISKLNEQDLRGWHFVMTSGLVLHLSPHGFDEGMHGRYAWVQDRPIFCLEGIKRLQAVLNHLAISPSQIFLIPDRDSEILAHATATEFQLPIKPWPPEGSQEPGLIVVYDPKQLSKALWEQLSIHHPGQILFYHAVCFTEDFPVAPDVHTYFYQFNTPPWGEKRVQSEDQTTWEILPPLEGAPEEIAKLITESDISDANLDDIPSLLQFVQSAALLQNKAGLALLQQQNRRLRQRTDSPVKSNQF